MRPAAASLYATPSSTRDLGDKIALLLDDASLRRQMSEFAVTAFPDRLSWDVQEPELLRAYGRAFAATDIAGNRHAHRSGAALVVR